MWCARKSRCHKQTHVPAYVTEFFSSSPVELTPLPSPLLCLPLYKPSKSTDFHHMAGRLGPRVVCRSIVVQLGKSWRVTTRVRSSVLAINTIFFWPSYVVTRPRSLIAFGDHNAEVHFSVEPLAITVEVFFHPMVPAVTTSHQE